MHGIEAGDGTGDALDNSPYKRRLRQERPYDDPSPKIQASQKILVVTRYRPKLWIRAEILNVCFDTRAVVTEVFQKQILTRYDLVNNN